MSTARPVTRSGVTRRAFNRLLTAGCSCGGLTGLALGGAARAQDVHYLRIGTGDVGGVYFRIGGILANVFSDPGYNTDCSDSGLCGVPGLIAISQATEGSVQNMALLEDGALEATLGQADVAYWAFRGEQLYDGAPHDKIRSVANLYSEAVHIAVHTDAPIETIADLRARRIVVGAEGSGSLIGAHLIFDAFGLSFSEIIPIYENLGPGVGLLRRGEADALFAITGTPAPSLLPLATDPGFRLLQIDDARAENVMTLAPFFTQTHIASGQYPGVDETPTLAVGAQFYVRKDLQEELVFELTRALWHPSNRSVLNNGHPLGHRIILTTALDGMAVPLHPGARRYYETTELPGRPEIPDDVEVPSEN